MIDRLPALNEREIAVNTLMVMVLSVSPGGGVVGVEFGDGTELLVAAGTAGVDDGIITTVEEEHL